MAYSPARSDDSYENNYSDDFSEDDDDDPTPVKSAPDKYRSPAAKGMFQFKYLSFNLM